MDSPPGEFYDSDNKTDTLPDKTSHFLDQTDNTETNDCVVVLRLENEESVDLQELLLANELNADNGNVNELYRKLTEFLATHQVDEQQSLQQVPAPLPCADEVLIEAQESGLEQNPEQTMPLVPNTELVTEQAETVPAPNQNNEAEGDGHVASSSADLPISASSGTMEQQAEGEDRPGPANKRRRKMDDDSASPAYQEKRQRNNMAVKKCRQKNKEKHMEIQQQVVELKKENDELKARNKQLSKKLAVYESLFVKKTPTDRPAQ